MGFCFDFSNLFYPLSNDDNETSKFLDNFFDEPLGTLSIIQADHLDHSVSPPEYSGECRDPLLVVRQPGLRWPDITDACDFS